MNPDDLYDLLDQAKQEEKLAFASFKEKLPTQDDQIEFLFSEWYRINRLINLMLTKEA